MSFSLRGKGLKLDSEEDIAPYIKELNAVENLQEIDLSGNTLGVEASKSLAEAIKTKKELKKADLSDIYTGRLRGEIPASLDYILSALLECKQLSTIDLSDNAFGIATIEPLEKFLSQHLPLEHLIMSNNGFGPEAGARIGSALDKLATAKVKAGVESPLETVVCGRNRLENGSMEKWAKFITSHGTLKELRLYQNGIRQEGIEHLILRGLANSPMLERLDLQDNTFTESGSRALAHALSSWKNLKELGVSDCLLTARGSELVAKALVDNGKLETLETLRLQYNEIEPRGLQHLHDAVLKNLTNLQLLELNGNRFGEDHELIDALTTIFEERGFGELDELDDMEEESESEEEEEEEDEEEREADILRDAEEEEDQNVAPEKSVSVDKLADEIAKTSI
jgi:Ran GTPase-activating protein 1